MKEISGKERVDPFALSSLKQRKAGLWTSRWNFEVPVVFEAFAYQLYTVLKCTSELGDVPVKFCVGDKNQYPFDSLSLAFLNSWKWRLNRKWSSPSNSVPSSHYVVRTRSVKRLLFENGVVVLGRSSWKAKLFTRLWHCIHPWTTEDRNYLNWRRRRTSTQEPSQSNLSSSSHEKWTPILIPNGTKGSWQVSRRWRRKRAIGFGVGVLLWRGQGFDGERTLLAE